MTLECQLVEVQLCLMMAKKGMMYHRMTNLKLVKLATLVTLAPVDMVPIQSDYHQNDVKIRTIHCS